MPVLEDFKRICLKIIFISFFFAEASNLITTGRYICILRVPIMKNKINALIGLRSTYQNRISEKSYSQYTQRQT